MSLLLSMWSGLNWYRIGDKTYYIPKVSKFSVERGYLCQQAWKCHLQDVNVYFTHQSIMQRGNPMELNFEGLKIQKWNIATDGTQRVDEKNGFICLVIMLTPRVMVIKMSKMAETAINQSQFRQNI